MRYLSLIFIVILVALKSNAQKSYSSIIEDSIINDFVGGIDVRNSFKNGRQIKTICKTIGVWSEEDLRQIELSANAVPWLKLHSEFINKQILSLNKLSLWNFDLPKKMKFLAYHYNDTEWMLIYSPPLFSKDGENCIIKVTKYWQYIFPEYKILAFTKQKENWKISGVIHKGIAPTNSLVLPTGEIKELQDSIASTIYLRCDTLDGELFNCYDSNGLKQGYWKRQKKEVLYRWSSYEGADGDRHGEEAIYLTDYEGHYKDNRKIGDWIYYDLTMWRLNLYEEKDTVKIVSYSDDGSVEKNFEFDYHLKFNADSSLVSGQINHPLDTIRVRCSNAECVFTTSKETEFLRFEQSKLKDKIFGLSIGAYDRKLRLENKKYND